MNKKLLYGLILLSLLAVGVALVLQYVNKPSDDFAATTPKASFTFQQLIEKTSSDTSSLTKLIDELVAVDGAIKKIMKDTASTTVELGDNSSNSSIICQIDNRHQTAFESFKEGQLVSIKGKLTGFTLDLDLGLGNTIQMNYCSINKK